MADNGDAVPEKVPVGDVEANYNADGSEFDDSKVKFINGGGQVQEERKPDTDTFTGLGKEELKKYADDPFWVRLRWILFILFWVGWLAMLVAAIIIIVLAPKCPSRPDLKWYQKEASYNIYAKSFFDKSEKQDGFGDLKGIETKAGHVEKMGASSLWLGAVLKTDLANDRSIVDYKKLDEKFGTVDALRTFSKRLMKTGKRIILDLIPNQTSKNHTWFMKSKKKEGKYAGYYIWVDGTAPPNNWRRASGESMWVEEGGRMYLSQFDGLPDLNLTNPDVINEFKEIINFWAGAGVSGFHINDVEYLAENSSLTDNDQDYSQTRNFEENDVVVDLFRGIVDGLDNKPGREKLIFGTARYADPMQMGMYLGGTGKRQLHMLGVDLSAKVNPTLTALTLEDMVQPFVNVSAKSGHWLGYRLTTPDRGSDRAVSHFGNSRMTVAHALQVLLPGSSLPYYGDEIAMSNGLTPALKTVTPMQWSTEANAGFTTGQPWLDVNLDYQYKNLDSMTAQFRDNKMVDSFIALNTLKSSSESLQFGKTNLCSKDGLFIMGRAAPGFKSYVVVINLLNANTSPKLKGSPCVGDHKMGKLVFHSGSEDHVSKDLDTSKSFEIGSNEVLVFEFPA